ncbi:hypothetical protein GCM10010254_57980 [Streptomyces chromofuscus]|nr:hypothetical protein GCM10010254_57980 [Streptomyces chromofuscus]
MRVPPDLAPFGGAVRLVAPRGGAAGVGASVASHVMAFLVLTVDSSGSVNQTHPIEWVSYEMHWGWTVPHGARGGSVPNDIGRLGCTHE